MDDGWTRDGSLIDAGRMGGLQLLVALRLQWPWGKRWKCKSARQGERRIGSSKKSSKRVLLGWWEGGEGCEQTVSGIARGFYQVKKWIYPK